MKYVIKQENNWHLKMNAPVDSSIRNDPIETDLTVRTIKVKSNINGGRSLTRLSFNPQLPYVVTLNGESSSLILTLAVNVLPIAATSNKITVMNSSVSVSSVIIGIVNSYSAVPAAYSATAVGTPEVYITNVQNGSFSAQILNNGAAVRNYDNILVQKGTVEIPRPISPLRIYSGRTYQIVINHLANALLNGNLVNAGFVGYFYPSMS